VSVVAAEVLDYKQGIETSCADTDSRIPKLELLGREEVVSPAGQSVVRCTVQTHLAPVLFGST